MTTQTIPLPGSAKPLQIDGPFPLSADQWEHAMTVLEAMKPGLVEHQADAEPFGSDDVEPAPAISLTGDPDD